MNAEHVPLAHPQLFETFAPRLSTWLLSHDSAKPVSVTVPARVPQFTVPPPAQACVPPVGQNEFGMVIVTLLFESTLHAVLVPFAAFAVASHDDQQFVETISMQPTVLFQSLGNASQFPSGDMMPIAFCPLKFQLSLVLNVWPSR